MMPKYIGLQNAPIKSKKGRFQELDSLRGVAALMVVFFHFTIGTPYSNWLFNIGTTGVDLFFITSGFVIFMSLSKISKSSDFIINRVSRLYPTYWTCVSFTFLLLSATVIHKYRSLASVPFTNYLANMTMFQFYLGVNDLDGPYWTMIVEMLFYIGILILFQFKLLKNLNWIGITLSCIVVILAHFFYDVIWVKEIIYWIPLLQFIPLFFAGTIFYKVYVNKDNLIFYYSVIVLCLLCQMSLFDYAGRSHKFISYYQYVILLTIFFGLFTLFVNNKLKFVINKITLFLGKISYALYLIHQYISKRIILPMLTEQFHINFWVAAIFITLPIVIMLAYVITFYIEVPLVKKVKEKLHYLFSSKKSQFV